MSVAIDFHIAVDWRWQRVKDLADAKASPSRSRDDQWVQRACRYQKRLATNHVRTEARLATTYPALHLAFEIHDNLCSSFLWIIEAAVLADVSREELATYLALTPAVIEAYEMLFFDVRSKLAAGGYVAGAILGPIVAHGVNGNDPDGFWKLLAFNGGWEHVKGCWNAGKATDVAVAFYRRVAAQQNILKAAASGLSIQPNSYNGVDLMRVGMEQGQYDDELGKGSSADSKNPAFRALIGNINVMVRNPRLKLAAVEQRLQLPDAAAIYAKAKKAPAVTEEASSGD